MNGDGRDLARLLAERLGPKAVIVGVGNPARGDDAAGCLVTQALRSAVTRRGPLAVRIVEAEDVPESYLGPIVDPVPDTVILVDAVEMGEAVGSVALLEVHELEGREASTHRPSLSLVAKYLWGATGADVFILGIQPGSRDLGQPPTPQVQEAADALACLLETALLIPGAATSPVQAFRAPSPEVPC